MGDDALQSSDAQSSLPAIPADSPFAANAAAAPLPNAASSAEPFSFSFSLDTTNAPAKSVATFDLAAPIVASAVSETRAESTHTASRKIGHARRRRGGATDEAQDEWEGEGEWEEARARASIRRPLGLPHTCRPCCPLTQRSPERRRRAQGEDEWEEGAEDGPAPAASSPAAPSLTFDFDASKFDLSSLSASLQPDPLPSKG